MLQSQEPDTLEMNNLLLRLMKGVNGQAFRAVGDKVVAGPFAGMTIPQYSPFWDDGNSGTKLFGQYEFELHHDVELAIERRPEFIVNVGCGDGYYAVGLAGRCPEAGVVGIDVSQEALSLCADYARINQVKVGVAAGAWSPEELRFEGVRGNRLYVIDCEGDELDLVDPERCPELASADLIIECHDFLKPGASKILYDRLFKTHRVILVKPQLPDLSKFPFLVNSPTVMAVLVLVVKRPMPCYWLTCWALRREELTDG